MTHTFKHGDPVILRGKYIRQNECMLSRSHVELEDGEQIGVFHQNIRPAPWEPVVGKRCYVQGWTETGVILDVDDKSALVQFGHYRFAVPFGKLGPAQ